MANFLTAYKLTAQNEGGYVNDPNDTGGETYCGISRKFFPTWSGWPVVDDHKPLHRGAIIPSLELIVEEFYKEHFWTPVGGDGIPDQDLANTVYDAAVNMGVHEALKLLTES